MSKRSATCADRESSQPPHQPPVDSSDGGGLLDLGHLGSLVPQISGTLGLGVSGIADPSGTDAAFAAHVGVADGPGVSVSLLGGTGLAGDSGFLGGLDTLDQSCLLDTIFGDCGLI